MCCNVGTCCAIPYRAVTIPYQYQVQPATGLSDADLAQLQFATQAGGQYLATALAAAGRTCWDCIGGTQGERNQQPPGCVDSGGHGKGPCPGCTGGLLNCSGARDGSCAADMRRYCAPAMQGRGMFMAWDPYSATDHNQTIAAFLVARPVKPTNQPACIQHQPVHTKQLTNVYKTNKKTRCMHM